MSFEHEAIHTWFGLSYANYLVVPRSVLQSMPDEWQERFVSCLQEMHEAFPDLEWPSYDVRVLRRGLQLIEEPNDCPQCDGAGDLNDEEECPTCNGTGTVPGDRDGDLRYELPEEVGFKRDPIPHYNRGRTRLGRNGAAA